MEKNNNLRPIMLDLTLVGMQVLHDTLAWQAVCYVWDFFSNEDNFSKKKIPLHATGEPVKVVSPLLWPRAR